MPEARPARPFEARRLGLWLVAAASIGLTIASTMQILAATLTPPEPATEYDCRNGIVALFESVGRARLAAAAVQDNEESALTLTARRSPTPGRRHQLSSDSVLPLKTGRRWPRFGPFPSSDMRKNARCAMKPPT